MKKTLYIIGFLMFASVLTGHLLKHNLNRADFKLNEMKIAHAANNTAPQKSDSSCNFPWNSCRLNVPDPNFATIFDQNDPEDVGKDLYMNIFNAVEVNPDKKTLEAMAKANGMPTAKMSSVLAGDLETVLHDNKNLTHQQAIQKVNLYQNQYAEMKQLFDLESEIDLEVGTNEMFANGDESDSGFDLIADLGNIENILFMKNEKIDVGGNFDGVTNSNDVAGNAINNSNAGQQAAQNNQSTNTKPTAINAANSNNNSPADAPLSNGTTPIVTANGGTNTSDNSNSGLNEAIRCLTPSVTDKALAIFDKKNTQNNATNNQNGGSGVVNSATVNQQSGSGIGGGSVQNGAENNTGGKTGSSNNTGAPNSTVQPATAGEWTKPGKCNDVFCLSVKFVSKPAVATYSDSDNCIACHVEKIVEKIKYTVTHTLLPGKVTGNILEPGICKSAASRMITGVPFHFYVNFKPVLTPVKDDLMMSANIVNEWEKFVNTYKPFKSPPSDTNPNDPAALPAETPLERATAEAVAYAAPSATYQDITNKISNELQQMSAIQADAVAVAEVSVQSDVAGGFYANVQREMDQMNFFFASFRDIFRSLHEKANSDDSGSHACSVIPEIPECGSL